MRSDPDRSHLDLLCSCCSDWAIETIGVRRGRIGDGQEHRKAAAMAGSVARDGDASIVGFDKGLDDRQSDTGAPGCAKIPVRKTRLRPVQYLYSATLRRLVLAHRVPTPEVHATIY